MPNITDVRSAFEAALNEINILDGALADERRSIKLSTSPSSRTPEQNARLKAIIESRIKLSESKEDLALSTISDFEHADNLDGLLEEIEASNADVQGTLEHLKTIEDYATKAAKVAGLLAKAATTLASFTG